MRCEAGLTEKKHQLTDFPPARPRPSAKRAASVSDGRRPNVDGQAAAAVGGVRRGDLAVTANEPCADQRTSPGRREC